VTKYLLAGVAAVGLMSGVAFAQTYIPTSPPAAAVGVPGSATTTTTVSPTTDHRTTITKGCRATRRTNRGSATALRAGLSGGL
jgi:hypothetical protein